MTSERADFIKSLAQEIRRVDGRHDLGADALAEALTPWIESQAVAGEAVYQVRRPGHMDPSWHEVAKVYHDKAVGMDGYETRTLYTAPQPAPVDAAVLMDKETVRRVAKAIVAARSGHPESYVWKQLGSNERKFADEVARSAIAALAAQQQESKS